MAILIIMAVYWGAYMGAKASCETGVGVFFTTIFGGTAALYGILWFGGAV